MELQNLSSAKSPAWFVKRTMSIMPKLGQKSWSPVKRVKGHELAMNQ